MSGSSYGGGVQWVAGAIEPRLDALIPDVAWHSLVSSFDRDGSFKVGWMLAVCLNGQVLGTLDGVLGLLGGTGLQLGSVAPQFTTMCVNGNLLGTLPPASVQWLASRGPGNLVDAVRAPTLITQGTVDTLFPPGEAIANYAALRANDVPVKMVWYCGGHGTCTMPAGDPLLLRETGLRWLRRWLMGDASVDTGPAFEWIDDGGVLRSAPDYPPASAGTLPASGAGSLLVLPSVGITDGPILIATPAIGAVEAQYAPPAAEANVVGEPTVTLTYRGTALPAATYLYAQVIDVAANRVVGNQVTPIPVILDGLLRTVTRKLEVVALRARPTSNLRVQVISSTPLYAAQHSTGLVWSMAVSSSLPLVTP